MTAEVLVGGVSMTHAIRVHAYGGPEVLKWEAVEVGEPGPGEVRLKQTAPVSSRLWAKA